MPSGRVRPERALFSSFREKHPRIYSFLYQTLLLIITFECAIAIARYGPERDGVNPAPASSAVPRTLLPRQPLPKTNSSTPHICVHGAREDYVDLGPQLIAITPYAILCPSTPFFILSLLTFTTGILKFHALQANPWPYAPLIMINANVWISIDWRNILVSLQIWMPMNIWIASVVMAVLHWLWRVSFPRSYERAREAMRRREEEERKAKDVQGQRVADADADVEMGGDGEREVRGEVGEETPLRS